MLLLKISFTFNLIEPILAILCELCLNLEDLAVIAVKVVFKTTNQTSIDIGTRVYLRLKLFSYTPLPLSNLPDFYHDFVFKLILSFHLALSEQLLHLHVKLADLLGQLLKRLHRALNLLKFFGLGLGIKLGPIYSSGSFFLVFFCLFNFGSLLLLGANHD